MEAGKHRKVALFSFPRPLTEKVLQPCDFGSIPFSPFPFFLHALQHRQLPRLMLSGDQPSISDCIALCMSVLATDAAHPNSVIISAFSFPYRCSCPHPSPVTQALRSASLQWNLNPINSKSCSLILRLKSLPSLLFSWLIVTCRL